MESTEKPKLGINEAIQHIHALMTNTEVMGAQDYEPSAFRNIVVAVMEGSITPEEGVRQADAIVEGKMDYH